MRLRLFALLLSLCMIFSLCAGCAASDTSADTRSEAAAAQENETPVEEVATEIAASETVENSAEPVQEQAESGYVPYSLPLVEEEVTLEVWLAQWFGFLTNYFEGYNDTDFWNLMEEHTGISFNISQSMDATTDFALILASGTAYDIMIDINSMYPGGVRGALDEGFIYNLADYQAELPNYYNLLNSDPQYMKSALTDNGELGGFYIVFQNSFPEGYMWIREDCMLGAGVTEVPKTIDQYTDMLHAIKNEYGYSPLWICPTGGMSGSMFGSAFDIPIDLQTDQVTPGSCLFYVVDGTVKYAPLEEGFRKYVDLMNGYWEDGLIFSDFMASLDNMGARDEEVSTGICVTPRSVQQASELAGMVEGSSWVPGYSPVVEEGQTLHFLSKKSPITGKGYYITTNGANTDIAMKFMDYMYSEEGQILANYGFEGVSMSFNAEGKPELDYDAFYNNPVYESSQVARVAYCGTMDAVGVYNQQISRDLYTDVQKEAIDIWSSNSDNAYCYPDICSFTEEEQEVLNLYLTDITTYLQETLAKFVIGEIDHEAEYDAFLDTLKEMHCDELVAIYQAAYDRFQAR